MNSQVVKIINRHLETNKELSQGQKHLVGEHLDFVHCLYGKLYIKGFRRLFACSNIVVMFKRYRNASQYLLVVLTEEEITSSDLDSMIAPCLNQLKKLNQAPAFQVLVGNLKLSEVRCLNSSMQSVEQPVRYLTQRKEQSENEITFESTHEFVMMNRIINEYIDRVGKFNKAVIKEQLSCYQLSFSIETLLQTVDCIIAERVTCSPYCYIESDEWSKFDLKQYSYLQKRRHTVLKGQGTILLMHWLFVKTIQDYLTPKQVQEIGMALKHYKDRYENVSIQIFCIHNDLEASNIRYKYQSKSFTLQDIPNMKRLLEVAIKDKACQKEVQSGQVKCIVLDD